MNKFIAILVFALGVNVTMYAQNSSMFGIRKVNTKAGAVVDAPRLNSKHYKIQTSKLLNDVDLTLFFMNMLMGNIKKMIWGVLCLLQYLKNILLIWILCLNYNLMELSNYMCFTQALRDTIICFLKKIKT